MSAELRSPPEGCARASDDDDDDISMTCKHDKKGERTSSRNTSTNNSLLATHCGSDFMTEVFEFLPISLQTHWRSTSRHVALAYDVYARDHKRAPLYIDHDHDDDDNNNHTPQDDCNESKRGETHLHPPSSCEHLQQGAANPASRGDVDDFSPRVPSSDERKEQKAAPAYQLSTTQTNGNNKKEKKNKAVSWSCAPLLPKNGLKPPRHADMQKPCELMPKRGINTTANGLRREWAYDEGNLLGKRVACGDSNPNDDDDEDNRAPPMVSCVVINLRSLSERRGFIHKASVLPCRDSTFKPRVEDLELCMWSKSDHRGRQQRDRALELTTTDNDEEEKESKSDEKALQEEHKQNEEEKENLLRARTFAEEQQLKAVTIEAGFFADVHRIRALRFDTTGCVCVAIKNDFLRGSSVVDGVNFSDFGWHVRYIGRGFLAESKIEHLPTMGALRSVTAAGRECLFRMPMLQSVSFSRVTPREDDKSHNFSPHHNVSSPNHGGGDDGDGGGNQTAYVSSRRSASSSSFQSMQLQSVDFGFLQSCSSLTAVNFDGLRRLSSIGAGFLASCSALKSVDFSPLQSLEEVGSIWCYGCTSLEHVHFSSRGSASRYASSLHTSSLLPPSSPMTKNNINNEEEVKEVPRRQHHHTFCQSLQRVEACWLAACPSLVSIDFSPLVALRTVGSLWLGRCAALEEVFLTPPTLSPATATSTIHTHADSLVSGGGGGGRSAGGGLVALYSVGGRWLAECPNLKRVHAQQPLSALALIGDNMLSGSLQLTHFTVSSSSSSSNIDCKHSKKNQKVVEEQEEDERQTTAAALPSPPAHVHFNAPNLLAVGSNWLSGCTQLKEVRLSNLMHLETVGDSWCADCPRLEVFSITTAPALTSIGCDWLFSATSLRHLTLIVGPRQQQKEQQEQKSVNASKQQQKTEAGAPAAQQLPMTSQREDDQTFVQIGHAWLVLAATTPGGGDPSSPRSLFSSSSTSSQPLPLAPPKSPWKLTTDLRCSRLDWHTFASTPTPQSYVAPNSVDRISKRSIKESWALTVALLSSDPFSLFAHMAENKNNFNCEKSKKQPQEPLSSSAAADKNKANSAKSDDSSDAAVSAFRIRQMASVSLRLVVSAKVETHTIDGNSTVVTPLSLLLCEQQRQEDDKTPLPTTAQLSYVDPFPPVPLQLIKLPLPPRLELLSHLAFACATCSHNDDDSGRSHRSALEFPYASCCGGGDEVGEATMSYSEKNKRKERRCCIS